MEDDVPILIGATAGDIHFTSKLLIFNFVSAVWEILVKRDGNRSLQVSTFYASCVTDIADCGRWQSDCCNWWPSYQTAATDDPVPRLLQLMTQFSDCCNWWPSSQTAANDDPVPRLLQMMTQFPDCCIWWPSSHKLRYISEFHKTFSLSPKSFRPRFCCPTWSEAIRLTNS